jgi:hypothetical protein
VAHTLIVIGYHLHKNQSNYEDLGGNYFDRIHSDGLKRYLLPSQRATHRRLPDRVGDRGTGEVPSARCPIQASAVLRLRIEMVPGQTPLA